MFEFREQFEGISVTVHRKTRPFRITFGFFIVIVASISFACETNDQVATPAAPTATAILVPTTTPEVKPASPRIPAIENSGSWSTSDYEFSSTPRIYVMKGPEHCGWENVTFLTIRTPFGTLAPSNTGRIQFVKDPLGILSSSTERFKSEFEADAELPADAEYSGYVNRGVELWVSETVFDTGIFMVKGDQVEKWPRVEPDFGCE